MMSDMSDTYDKGLPKRWLIAQDFDPNAHMMNLKGKDYLNVQNRLLWFIRDQREMVARAIATCSYVVRTELVELDREAGFAHYKTYVRDVLGNEATMYGSETARDFGDYAEKASTKSLGRALWALGYGTGMAPEMDESEDRPVDSPIAPIPPAMAQAARDAAAATATAKQPYRTATPTQWDTIRRGCAALDREPPEPPMSFEEAGALIGKLSEEYKQHIAKQQKAGAR